MKNWIKYGGVAIIGTIILILMALGSAVYYDTNYSKGNYETYEEEKWINPLNEEKIEDNKELYKLNEKLHVNKVYITVLKNQDDDNTFNKIININNVTGETGVKLEVFFETEEKNILNNGLYIKEPNADIQIRGKSSQKSPQKSLKITLFEKTGLWKGQKVIDLNKYYSDSMRIRNKLSAEYITLIPNVTSYKTNFVRLFIRDLSGKNNSAAFEDYGLFTQVEQPNKLFLKSHNLDPNGQLYKAKEFDFSRKEDIIKEKGSEGYLKSEFEKVLQIEGDDNHKKLIDLLNQVNNPNNDINEIVDKYFDRENYITWLAINILFDNYEVNKASYLLYSPLNSNKWYFLPWDFDKAWGSLKDRAKWQRGVSMYYDNILHKRFLNNPQNVEELTTKIEELSKIVNEKQTKILLDRYYEILMANLTQLPDLKYLPMEIEKLKEEYYKLSEVTEESKLYYYESIKAPMPFNIDEPSYDGQSLTLKWERACDLQGQNVNYDLLLSEYIDFANIKYSIKDLQETEHKINGIQKGTYYIKIIAKDSEGNYQIPYNTYESGSDDEYFGVKKIILR